ncbi:MAG: hypothetical protein HYR67_12580 [Bacteroidetes bacterium]|nr:hypothetical protein [Bacteroidota bacterium]
MLFVIVCYKFTLLAILFEKSQRLDLSIQFIHLAKLICENFGFQGFTAGVKFCSLFGRVAGKSCTNGFYIARCFFHNAHFTSIV